MKGDTVDEQLDPMHAGRQKPVCAPHESVEFVLTSDQRARLRRFGAARDQPDAHDDCPHTR
jgi:hypothetical protein